MPVVLVDVDGVLADFVGALCRELRREGFNRSPEDFCSYDHREVLSAEEQAAMRVIVDHPGFCYGIEPYEGATGFLSRLRRYYGPRNVVALTAPWPSPTWVDERFAWLERRMGFQREDVIFCPSARKHLVRGDVLIEDHADTAAAWWREHRTGWAVLLKRPWNEPRPHVHYARDYEDALGY